MELEMKKAQKLEDGMHTGKITDVSYDTDPYKYTRIVIEIDNQDGFTMDHSCPTNLSENSKLMTLLKGFGIQFQEGVKIDPSNVLNGQKIQFMTISAPSKKDASKVYSRVVEGSIKPFSQAP